MQHSIEIRHFHIYAGLGGGARGFNQGRAEIGNLKARFRCIGGVDVDAAAMRDFEHLAGVPGTVLDLFSREQYRDFHGREPGETWREAVEEDIRMAAGGEFPHIVFLSAPCKGFSGLLSEGKSKSPKYQALNGLTLRGLWLTLEAFKDDPPALFVFENVPRIATRGRWLLDQITGLLRSYGYAVAETTHDCGHLGGLAQSRKRFLLVARHMEKVPSFLYEPVKRRLLAVGDILGRMPMPGDMTAGPMHRIPSLQWKTWVRLAFVEAGSDWRSLNRLAVEDGYLRDFAIMPETVWQRNVLGVLGWDDTAGTITGRSSPTTGRFAVADPGRDGSGFSKYTVTPYDAPSGTVLAGSTTGQGAYAVADMLPKNELRSAALGVLDYAAPSGVVAGESLPSNGTFAVADPKHERVRMNNVFRVVSYADHAGTVTGGHGPSSGGQGVADPRTGYSSRAHQNLFRVIPWDAASRTIVSAGHPAGGALSVADVRCGLSRDKGDNYLTAGHYGVLGWDEPSGAVSASACHDNGYFSVADGRLPGLDEKLTCCIIAPDNTWHRPFTTLELAALQGLLDPEEHLELDGLSDSAWRERIGNAVPPPAAAAIASVMGEVLLLTWSGQTFSMGNTPIWVRPVAAALMAARGEV